MFLGIQHKMLSAVLTAAVLLSGVALQAAEKSTADLISAAKSGDESARCKAIDQLGAHGANAAEAVAPLTELLGDKSATIRAHAVHALGQIGEPAKSAVESILALAKDPDPSVRRQAVKAIMALHPGPKVMIPLFVKLMEDSDPGVKLRILDAVTDAGPAALPGLIEALNNPKAAYWSCIVLRQLGPVAKSAVPALTKTLADKNPEIRREAALALGAIGPAAETAAPQIAALLEDPLVREAATFALGQIGKMPSAAIIKVKDNARSDDKFLSTISYWALARVQPDNKELRRETTTRLVEMLGDKNPFVRAAAGRGLASLPPAPEITLPIWDKFMATADEETAHHALNALAGLGPAAVPRLMKLLKYEKLRGSIAEIFGSLGPAAAPATAALSTMLTDKDPHVVTEAALALGKIGPAAASAVPALTSALEQQDCSNSHAIVMALGKIGPAAAVAEPAIQKGMKSDDHSLACISAWALVRMHPNSAVKAQAAVPVLIVGLNESLPESRRAAAEALGSLGKQVAAAIPALEKAVQDPDKSVGAAATQAIHSIRDSK